MSDKPSCELMKNTNDQTSIKRSLLLSLNQQTSEISSLTNNTAERRYKNGLNKIQKSVLTITNREDKGFHFGSRNDLRTGRSMKSKNTETNSIHF